MTKSAPFRRVSLVGVGLIGGSWGLALKQCGFEGLITGCDRSAVLDRALALGAIDAAQPDLAAAVHEADLVILAAPVGVILEQLPQVREAASPRALITDTGSTKRAILQRARAIFSGEPLFLGGHPLAGKEQSGIENAHEEMFRGKWYVLSELAPENLTDGRLFAFQKLIELSGARPYFCDAETHDRAMAFLSHLPQLLSTGLASMVSDEHRTNPLPLDLAGTGFRDMTRLAESPYAIWRDVCQTNRDHLRQALDAMIHEMEAIRDELGEDRLEENFHQAIELRERWRSFKRIN
jgi:prephenate dehydrogenase